MFYVHVTKNNMEDFVARISFANFLYLTMTIKWFENIIRFWLYNNWSNFDIKIKCEGNNVIFDEIISSD